ncbi:MAG: hypothetical protein A2W99_01240 [Bacteroidetes bacterium GWF2_33_16]|nr:MAG: hypothetical protein A2X00_03945 [Bacteroidetes bacterium GWE2_32_14]OFY08883.1 MAG: hypothetical protein A2W99_01240 [Bacteroidetes bacterium GWF2_33_16]
MKKNLITLILGCLISTSYAQDYIPSESDLNQFLNSKLYVVLESNPIAEYNFKIQESIKNEWTLTPYEFISVKDFETMFTDPGKSFLMMTQVVFENDQTKVRYNFLSMFLGKKDAKLIRELNDIAAIPLSYTEVDEEFWVYKMDALVRFMQNHIINMRDNPNMIKKNILQYYNENMKDIKQKTLYLIKEEVSPSLNTEDKLKKIYPFSVKFVTSAEVEQAINDRDPNIVFLHKVGPQGTRLKARCYKMIVGAADANFYYFDYHWVEKGKKDDGLLDKDFKKMAKKK